MTKAKGISGTKFEHDLRATMIEVAQQRKLLDELVADVRALYNCASPHLQYVTYQGADHDRAEHELRELRERVDQLEKRELANGVWLADLEGELLKKLADLEDEVGGVGNLAQRLAHVSPEY
jgi:hypothetical protein